MPPVPPNFAFAMGSHRRPRARVTPRDDDASITQGVVDTIAADPYMRAERDAYSVYGVRNVQNHLATRIGPHTH